MHYQTLLSAFLFCSLFSFSVAAQSTSPACEHPDYIGLKAIYDATDGDNWVRTDGWTDTCEPCQWYGVRCDPNGRVTSLALANNGLVGELPEEIGSIVYLSTMSAPGNAISGSLPESLYRLDVWDLYLSDNFITGELSENKSALKNLRFLRLQNNDLTGALPQGLSNLRNLRRLHLEGNQFSGAFPEGIADLPSLDIIDVRDNQLMGCLPEDLRNRCGDSGVRFTGNGGLPWSGDFNDFCADGLNSDQVGAPCNDGNPNTFDEVINENCDCAPQPDGLQTVGFDNVAQDLSGQQDPGLPTGDTVESGLQVPDAAVQAVFQNTAVYPNPFTGTELTVNLPGNTGQAGLRLYSITGTTVATQIATGEVASVPVPQLTPGFYLVEIFIDGERTVKKLMVE